jgi:hypothetical protein
MKQRYKKPPNVGKDKKRADAQYEEPFEAQKARQDKARETPSLGDEAFHGVTGQIARKVAKETEADGRAILVGLLVGCGNIIGRTAYCRVDATHHFGSEFACLVGRTAGARKGLATDLVEEILRLTSDVWHQGCTVRGVSSGEGFIELVHDEVTKLVKVKREKGDKGAVQYDAGCKRGSCRQAQTLPSVGVRRAADRFNPGWQYHFNRAAQLLGRKDA